MPTSLLRAERPRSKPEPSAVLGALLPPSGASIPAPERSRRGPTTPTPPPPTPLSVAPSGRRFCGHPGVRPDEDRPGDRVRLLLGPRGQDLSRARLRGRDGQLQPGDGLDRLRHLQPALLRASLRRRGAGDLRPRAAG